MRKITKKQKIIIIVILIIVAATVCYYAYAKEKDNTIEELGIESNETQIENSEGNSEKNNNKTTIKVHISGAVQNEGVIELEENSRIADAVEKAGGYTEDASVEEINLAYMLEDGMKIKIPTKEEVKNQTQPQNWIQTDYQAAGQEEYQSSEQSQIQSIGGQTQNTNISYATSSKSNKSNKTTQKVNINTATQAELETLPGIGENTAIKIITYRKEQGKFKSIEDIKQVSGIGESKYKKMKDLITI